MRREGLSLACPVGCFEYSVLSISLCCRHPRNINYVGQLKNTLFDESTLCLMRLYVLVGGCLLCTHHGNQQ